MFKNAELIAQPKIDRATSEMIIGQRRLDLNFSLGDVAPDIYVGKDHEPAMPVFWHTRPDVDRKRKLFGVDSDMLSIRSSQMAVFGAASVDRFTEGLVEHIQAVFSDRCSEWGQERTQEFVRRNVERAIKHDIRTDAGIVAFVEWLAEYGEQFEEHPANEQALETLRDSSLPGQIKIVLIGECLASAVSGRQIVPYSG